MYKLGQDKQVTQGITSSTASSLYDLEENESKYEVSYI